MRRPDNEPLLFDLPLDRPARDDETEPLLDRQPPAERSEPPPPSRQPRPARPAGRTPPPAAASSPRARAESEEMPPEAEVPQRAAARAPRLPLASAAALAAQARAQAQAQAAQSPHPAHTGEPEDEDSAVHGAAGPALGRRLAAAAADLLVQAAVTVVALFGCVYLGVMPALRDWPAVAVFVLSFSFLYTVVPLAFWGHTLGMTWAGLRAENEDGEPLSFDQTARRWLGALLTLAILGLPLLLALAGGRSLADRLSGSHTLVA
jgi:uncharacterized RDD family membrane protein YckC